MSSEAVARLSQALNEGSQTDSTKVGIGAGAFLGLAAATLLLFEVVRSNNKMVYEPKRKYPEPNTSTPPAIRYSPLGWLNAYKEDRLLPLVGLDAVVFLRFLRMMRLLVTALAIVLCAVLIPVDLIYHANNPLPAYSDGKENKTSILAKMTLSGVSGGSIWAHVAMSYIATALVLFFITINYRHIVRLRWEWFRTEEYQNSFHARTLMLTQVPRQLQSDAALTAVLSSIGMPYPTTEVHIGRVVGALPDLIEKHEETVRKLERVFAKYLKDPNKVPAKRPTIRVGGKRVDSIEHYTAQITKLEAAIEQWRERIAEKKPEMFGFASLAAVPYAHAAAKSLKGKKTKGIEITLAPSPRDVIWRNLTLTKAARTRSSIIGFLWLVLLCFINAVPLLAVALISQMGSFMDVLPFLGKWQYVSKWSFSAVAGLLPPAISGLAGYLLPILMRRIAKYRGITTRTRLDRVITSQYFAFLVISQFLIFTLVGVAITVIATIVAQVNKGESFDQILGYISNDVGPLVLRQYINFSNYWLTYLPLRLWIALFDLAQGVRLLLVWFQKNFLGRTPRDYRDFSKPPVAEYAILYSNLLFVFAVAMLYACLAPLVVAFAAVVFWVASIVFKYQMMYVYRTKVESGGRLWRVIVNRLLACIVFMQLILALALLLQGAGTNRLKAIAALPPVLAVIGFKIYCGRTFDRRFDWYIPEGAELANCKVHGGDVRHNRLQRRFGHPALHQRLFTPMVHAKVKHLLPQIYRGRLEQNIENLDGRKVEIEEIGGLRIAAIEEDQLEYDPRNDSDVRSIMSGTTMQGGWGTPGPGTPTGGPRQPSRSNTYDFRDQYANYLAGTGAPGLPPNASREDFEMGNIMARDSRDNLLEKAAPPGSLYSSEHTYVGGAHAKKASQGSYPYHAETTPGLEMPPQTNMNTPGYNTHVPQESNYSSHVPRESAGGGYFPAAAPRQGSVPPQQQQQYYQHGPQASYGAPYTASPQGSPRGTPGQASPYAAANMYAQPAQQAPPPGAPGYPAQGQPQRQHHPSSSGSGFNPNAPGYGAPPPGGYRGPPGSGGGSYGGGGRQPSGGY